MLVLKFGGSSVGNPKGIEKIIGIIKENNQSPVVVVSAFSGVTNTLINLANMAVKEELYSQQVENLGKRHKDCVTQFLKDTDRKNAFKEIDRNIEMLLQILDGICLLGELSLRSLDLVMSFGELLSANLISFIFRANNIKAEIFSNPKDQRTNDYISGRFG